MSLIRLYSFDLCGLLPITTKTAIAKDKKLLDILISGREFFSKEGAIAAMSLAIDEAIAKDSSMEKILGDIDFNMVKKYVTEYYVQNHVFFIKDEVVWKELNKKAVGEDKLLLDHFYYLKEVNTGKKFLIKYIKPHHSMIFIIDAILGRINLPVMDENKYLFTETTDYF